MSLLASLAPYDHWELTSSGAFARVLKDSADAIDIEGFPGSGVFHTLVKLRIPAKRVPETVERFVGLYQRERKDGEEFNAFFDRVGEEPFLAAAQDLTLPPDFGPDTLPMFIDWERDGLYILQRGEGECAV